MNELLSDKAAFTRDQQEWTAAQREAASIEASLAQARTWKPEITPRARLEIVRIATSVGMMAMVGALCVELVL